MTFAQGSMEVLEEEEDGGNPIPLGSPRSNPNEFARQQRQLQAEKNLLEIQQRLTKTAQEQNATLAGFRIVALLLSARLLLLLGLMAASALSAMVVLDPSPSLPKMILVAAYDAILVFPLVGLYLKKG